MAARDQFVDSDYQHVVHLMPPSTCRFGGVANMPGRYSWTVANPGDGGETAITAMHRRIRQVTSHELGHNFGVHHAGSLRCTDASGATVSYSTNCTVAEYGDPFNVMGTSRLERQLHGYHKGRLKWLNAASADETLTVTTDSSVTLTPVESAAGLRSVRVLRASSRKAGSEYYYLDFRGPQGFSGFSADDAAATGVSIRLAPDYGTNAVSKLIDATPETLDFADAPLGAGKTFTDAARGVSFTVTAVNPGQSATVQITFASSSDGTTPTKPGKGNSK